MTNESDFEPPEQRAGAFSQISIRQWVIALVVMIAIPAIAYAGYFYLYPYVQDQLEGESPADLVLAEYGVEEDAETQLLDIRRGDLVNSVAINGSLEYANRERLSFGLAGTVETVNVEVGDHVSEGDVLMSLSADAVVSAEQRFQDASVALQNAEEALDALVNPDQREIEAAELAILDATKKLEDAESKLDDLWEPTELEIENAELALSKAAKAVSDAETKLDDLINPSKIDIENAELAVLQAEQAITTAQEKLEELQSIESADVVAAEHKINEALKEWDNAFEALADLKATDQSAIVKAESDIEKARLAIVDAQQKLVDAERKLADAEDLTDVEFEFEVEVSQAEAAITAAKLEIDRAQEALDDGQNPYESEDVADLSERIVEARDDVQVAKDQLAKLEIEDESDEEELVTALNDARTAYQDVFDKWLGMDIAGYEWKASPDDIFAALGKSLAQIMGFGESVDRIVFPDPITSSWLEDDPNTPWSETVIASWREFYLQDMRFDCDEPSTRNYEACVNLDFENAWDEVALRSEAYEKFNLAKSQKIDNATDAVEAAERSLENLEDELAELIVPTDQVVIDDLVSKLIVAEIKQREAEITLTDLMADKAVREQDWQAQRMRAEQDLVVAQEELKVAQDALVQSIDDLAELQADASKIDVTLAESRIVKAESDVAVAREALNDLSVFDDDAIERTEKDIEVARADLESKIDALETLLNPDAEDIEVLEQEIVVAESELDDKIQQLDDLFAIDDLDVEIARQEIEVARSDITVARESLDDLLNPDPVTVAQREAEVASAQEELDSALTAIDQAQIVAPFDGVVSSVSAEEGESVNDQRVVVEVADSSIVEVSGTVDEVDVLFLQVGDQATISLEALGDQHLIGRISEIAAFGDSSQGVVTYPVTIQTEQPPDTQLPEGLSAVAEVVIREQTDKLLVPIQALFGSVNEPILLISKSDGTIEPRPVSLGISDDFWTVVEDGVSEGETVFMTVVGSDTSQFSGFRAISASTRVISSGPPRR